MLGTHAIYVNSLGAGTISELEERFEWLFHLGSESYGRGGDQESDRGSRDACSSRQREKMRDRILRNKIDLTAYLVWFIENYPQSIKEMKANPAMQQRFISAPREEV